MNFDRQYRLLSTLFSLVRQNQFRVLVSVSLTLLSGVATGGSFFALLPLLESVGIPQNPTNQSRAFELVNTVWTTLGLRLTLYGSLTVYVAFTLFQALLGYVRSVLNVRIVEETKQTLRNELFSATIEAEWGFIKDQKNTRIFNNLISEINTIGYLMTTLIGACSTFILFCVYLGTSLFVSFKMTVFAALCFLPLLIVQRRLNRQAYKTGEDMYGRHERLFGAVLEFINSFKLAKSYSFQDRYVSEFREITRQTVQDEHRFVRISAATDMLYQVGMALVISFVLIWSIQVAHIPMVDLLLMVYVASKLLPNFSTLVRNYQYILSTFPSCEGVFSLLYNTKQYKEQDNPELSTTFPQETIRFANVGFRYESDKPIFDGFNCLISINKTTSIMGASGQGKTTFVELLLGLLKPQQGEIWIDNTNLACVNLRDWRKTTAYIPQECFLFHTTIRQNLLWAKPDATEADLRAVLKLVAGNFVFELPNGLETVVGDQGIRLSGGERQRIALARAMLRAPKLLILDEATNALDSANELLIKQTIDQLKGKVTILLIAHSDYLHEGTDKTIVLGSFAESYINPHPVGWPVLTATDVGCN